MLTEDAAKQIKQMHKNRGDAHQIIVSTLFFMMVQNMMLGKVITIDGAPAVWGVHTKPNTVDFLDFIVG